MNRLTIIGNLTADPQSNTTPAGKEVCNFTVAVNRPKKAQNPQGNQPDADFFQVSAWNELANTCQQYLSKGRKVCVVGPVSVNTYTGQDGNTRASLNVQAYEVEFLTPRGEGQTQQEQTKPADPQVNMTPVEDPDEMPF